MVIGVRKALPLTLDARYIQHFNDCDMVRFDAASISFFVYRYHFTYSHYQPLSISLSPLHIDPLYDATLSRHSRFDHLLTVYRLACISRFSSPPDSFDSEIHSLE